MAQIAGLYMYAAVIAVQAQGDSAATEASKDAARAPGNAATATADTRGNLMGQAEVVSAARDSKPARMQKDCSEASRQEAQLWQNCTCGRRTEV